MHIELKIVWYNNSWFQWQLNNLNEQTFSLLQIAFQDLVPSVEGEQQDFFYWTNATKADHFGNWSWILGTKWEFYL
jgi:hypothetical protein